MPLKDEDLCVHVLNVGQGDNIIIEFPSVDGQRKYAVVDCYLPEKTLGYLDKLGVQELEFICATHPHKDHIDGIPTVLDSYKGHIKEYWESGFRHTIDAYDDIIEKLDEDTDIGWYRVTSGLERVCNGVKVCVLAPSIYLRNRYDTYGVHLNNASVVLKLEYQADDVMNPGVVILAGDAQFLNWAKIADEYPNYKPSENPDSKIQIEDAFNPLHCHVLKVSHHGSKHGTALEFVEIMGPTHAVITCSNYGNHDFPDDITVLSLKEVSNVYYTDYSVPGSSKSGTVAFKTRGSKNFYFKELNDEIDEIPDIPDW